MGTPAAAHATPESSIQASQDSRGTEYTSFRPFETYRNGRGNARQPQRKREREDDSDDDDDDVNEDCPGKSPTQASSPRTILPIKRRSNPKGTAATSSPVSPSKSSGPANAESGSSNTGFSGAGIDLEAQTSTGESHGLNLYPFPLPQFDGASGSRPWGPYPQQAAPQQQSAVPLVPLGGVQAQAADAADDDDDDDNDDGQLPPNPAPTPVTAQAPAPVAAAPPNPAPQKRTCFCLDPESCNPMCCVTWCQRLSCGSLSFNKRLLLLFAIVMVGLTIAYFYLVKDHFLPKDKDKQA